MEASTEKRATPPQVSPASLALLRRVRARDAGKSGALPAEHRKRAQPTGEPAGFAVAVGRNIEVRICCTEGQVQLLTRCREFHDVVRILRVHLFLLFLMHSVSVLRKTFIVMWKV